MPLLSRNLPLVDSANVSPASYMINAPVPAVAQVNAAAQIVANSAANYNMSVNLTQGIIAGIEAQIFQGQDALLIGALVLLSSAVPPSGVIGYFGDNEKLWELLIATFIGGAILKGVHGRSYMHQAGRMFLFDSSSMALTDQIYTIFILGGANAQVAAYRLSYPEAGYVNRAFLG